MTKKKEKRFRYGALFIICCIQLYKANAYFSFQQGTIFWSLEQVDGVLSDDREELSYEDENYYLVARDAFDCEEMIPVGRDEDMYLYRFKDDLENEFIVGIRNGEKHIFSKSKKDVMNGKISKIWLSEDTNVTKREDLEILSQLFDYSNTRNEWGRYDDSREPYGQNIHYDMIIYREQCFVGLSPRFEIISKGEKYWYRQLTPQVEYYQIIDKQIIETLDKYLSDHYKEKYEEQEEKPYEGEN